MQKIDNTDVVFRHLNFDDYDKKYFDLLSQLTICNIIEREKFNNFIKKLDNNTHIILVCEINNKIVASGTLFMEQKLIRDYGKVGHIEDIVVDKEYNGHGLGKKLLEELKNYAYLKNCYKVILDCRNEVVKFYEKCGFTQKEVEMVFYFAK